MPPFIYVSKAGKYQAYNPKLYKVEVTKETPKYYWCNQKTATHILGVGGEVSSWLIHYKYKKASRNVFLSELSAVAHQIGMLINRRNSLTRELAEIEIGLSKTKAHRDELSKTN